MRAWGVVALVWVASCNDGDTGPSGTPALAAPDASASSSGGLSPGTGAVGVHAVFDLPRTARTRTLSGLAGEGPVFYAVPDKDRRIVTLTANAEYTGFEADEGIALSGLIYPTWDGEGIARASDGSFYLVADETAPSIVQVSPEGALLREIAVPERYRAQPRNNKGLESLSLAPSGAFLFTCNESALTVDGPAATKTQGTVVRLLRLPVDEAGTPSEFAYRTEPLGAGSGGDMGVSEVHALSDDSLLVLERGYQSDYGNTVRVFRVSVSGARDASTLDTLGEAPAVVEKELIVDVATLPPGNVVHPAKQPNPLLDNYESLTLGPMLPDGRRLLLLLSDDNGQASQVARVLVLAVRGL